LDGITRVVQLAVDSLDVLRPDGGVSDLVAFLLKIRIPASACLFAVHGGQAGRVAPAALGANHLAPHRAERAQTTHATDRTPRIIHLSGQALRVATSLDRAASSAAPAAGLRVGIGPWPRPRMR